MLIITQLPYLAKSVKNTPIKTLQKAYFVVVIVDDDVHADLTDLGKKNESYSDVIRRLIKFYNDNQGGRHKKSLTQILKDSK